MFSVIVAVVLGMGPPQMRVWAAQETSCTTASTVWQATNLTKAEAKEGITIHVTQAQCMDANTLRGFTDDMVLISKGHESMTFAKGL